MLTYWTRRAGLLLLALTLGACATTGTVVPDSIGALRTGVAVADEQSRSAFESANSLAIDQSIESKISNPSIQLAEADFQKAVDPTDSAAWRAAFAVLDDYLEALQSLVGSSRSADAGNQIGAIGAALRDGPLQAKLPAKAVGGFAQLGEALVQMRAERAAIRVMRTTDPAFRETMAAMARAIGDEESTDVRGTVRTNWQRVLSRMRDRYSELAPDARGFLSTDVLAERRRLALDFVDAMESRNASDATLLDLRATFLALGEAHHAASLGRGGDTLFWIERMSGWADSAKTRIEATEAEREE